MGKLKALIPFLLAIVVALVSSVLIYNWIQQKTNAPQVTTQAPTEERSQIVLASADLSWGTKITEEMVKSAPIANAYAPAGRFTSPAQVVGRVLISPIKENEPMLEFKLAPKDVTTGGVSAVVSQGKRAIAVAGDKVIGLGGFIQPGNMVDILVTITDQENDKLHYTKTVLENIKVLATGAIVENKGKGNEPAPVDVFTVEVTPDEGERLSLAASQGKLHFALRNVTDTATVLTLGATVADTLDAYRPKLQLVKEQGVKMEPPKAEARRTYKMEVINGTAVKQVTF